MNQFVNVAANLQELEPGDDNYSPKPVRVPIIDDGYNGMQSTLAANVDDGQSFYTSHLECGKSFPRTNPYHFPAQATVH